MSVNFSSRLTAVKVSTRMNGEELAAALGMSKRMLGYYLAGDYDGDPKKVAKYLPNLEQLEKGKLPIKKEDSEGYWEQEIKVLKLQLEHQKQTIELLERENQMYRKLLDNNLPTPKTTKNMKK